MNKTAIKNFAIWARNKLIADISYKAGLLGITEAEIKNPLPQSTETVHFFDIGTKEPYSISGVEIEQRKKLVEEIQRKASQSDYKTAYKSVVEEVAYTWFNRLIAIRFMEVNDYLPTRIRVLSSESSNKAEPDLVTYPMDANFEYTPYEKDRIMQLKQDNKLDELFRMLFIKQCNALNAILPELFEKTNDFTEILLNVSFTDQDGVVYHLVNDIPEDDFNVSQKGQVEIIGWMYQYYNTEPKDETFALLKKNVKITKERIPAATQLFTPNWIVRYMVENSLGRLWLEGHPDETLKSKWKYYLDEAEQEADVQKQLDEIREEYKKIKPEDIKVIDPCMGSGHILVYAFDVLMQIYESYGYSQRDAAKSIIENNLYGLDIDNRAYQLAYFAVMMKARQYNRRILNGETICHLYSVEESNNINRNHLKFLGEGLSNSERDHAKADLEGLLNTFIDGKEYGSLVTVESFNFELLRTFVLSREDKVQISFDTVGLEKTQAQLLTLINIGMLLAQKYDVVITNPPYMGSSGMNRKVSDFVKNYPDCKSDLFAVFIEKGLSMANTSGLVSMITMESWMFLSSFQKMRQKILDTITIRNFVHMPYLGKGGTSLGINFGTSAVIFDKLKVRKYQTQCCYIRYYETSKDGIPLAFPTINERYKKVISENLSKIPGSPIAYWVSKKTLKIFDNITIADVGSSRSGMQTGNNNLFLKMWFEVPVLKIGFGFKSMEDFMGSNKKWIPQPKGGPYRKWYGNLDYVVNFENNGRDLKNYEGTSIIKNPQFYFKKGVSWSHTTSKSFSARLMPNGCIFNVEAPTFYPEFEQDLKYYLGFFNTSILEKLFSYISQTMHYMAGDMAKMPVIISQKHKSKIDSLVEQNILFSKADWNSFETSWDFKYHPLIESRGYTVGFSFDKWKEKCENRFQQMKSNEEELNNIFAEIYDLQDELNTKVEEENVTIYRVFDSKKEVSPSMKGSKYILTKQDVIKSFISYAVGYMFGRYSLDVKGLAYAGGEWDESKYSTFIPDENNIIPISDEEYFKDDIVGLFTAFVKKVYGEETIKENLDFIAKALGNKGNSSREIIRNYLLKDFFKDHCKIYQKRPIYWLFNSGKANGFKALVYMHRYNENTIGNLRIDYLHRIQRIYESEISRMQETIENSKDAREVTAATKRKEKLLKQLKETKEYDEKIAHLALARTAIDLDDGVKVNYEKVQTDMEGRKLEVLAKI